MKKIVVSLFLMIILAIPLSAQTDGRDSLYMSIDNISITRDNDFVGESSSAYFEFFIAIKIHNPHSENITVFHNGCQFTAGIEVGENGTYIGETQYLTEQIGIACIEIALLIEYPPGESYQNTTQWFEVKDYDKETIPNGQYYITVDGKEYDNQTDNYFGAYLDKSSLATVLEYEQGYTLYTLPTEPAFLPIEITGVIAAIVIVPIIVKIKK